MSRTGSEPLSPGAGSEVCQQESLSTEAPLMPARSAFSQWAVHSCKLSVFFGSGTTEPCASVVFKTESERGKEWQGLSDSFNR